MSQHFQPATHSDDEPLTAKQLLDLDNEPARAAVPESLHSYVAINGVMFDDPTGNKVEPLLGFKRLLGSETTGAWTVSASHAVRWGLPVRTSRRVVKPEIAAAAGESRRIETAFHQPWNANVFHPRIARRAEAVHRTKRGGRAVPTGSIDALIFGTDDRLTYYPQGYPWHCIGKLEVQADGISTSGSGALVGRDLVLTARHVVPWGAGSFSIKFTPAFYEGRSTLGTSYYSWIDTATAYEGDDVGAWDFALLRLYQPLGDHLGYFGVRTYHDSWDDRNLWTACGYPVMPPFDGNYPAYLNGVAIDDADDDGDATELESENQDNSKGASGGPLWARWANGPHIVGVVSANEKFDYFFENDYQVLNASGKAMVELVGLARLEINTDIHIIRPPDLNLGER